MDGVGGSELSRSEAEGRPDERAKSFRAVDVDGRLQKEQASQPFALGLMYEFKPTLGDGLRALKRSREAGVFATPLRTELRKGTRPRTWSPRNETRS